MVNELYASKNYLASSGWDYWGNNEFAPMQKSVRYLSDSRVTSATNFKGQISGMKVVHEESYDKVFTNVDITDSITGDRIVNGRIIKKSGPIKPVQIRKNFNETAFFFPQLQADSLGNYRFSFTLPDAVTKWKWMGLAHTKDLSFGLNTEEIITQKTLMVQPNAPRFMREGDNMEFSSKIVNLSDKELTGTISLAMMDASSNRSVDGWFQNIFPNQYFTAEAGQSVVVKFPIQIPFSFNKPLTWTIVAKAGEFSDGIENTIPVITNRQLVTETMPLFLEKDSAVQFNFTKLLNSNSASATNQSLRVEFTSNPLWTVVQALPYLMQPSHESVEQLFHRLYANLLATYIVQKNPAIKVIFEAWKKDSSILKSSLEKNPDLKQVLLAETPWVLQANNESQQKKQIAQLFEEATLATQANELLDQLFQMQLADGSFPWFKGGYSDPSITNIILTGIGKLKKIGAIDPSMGIQLRPMIIKALAFSDAAIETSYQILKSSKTDLAKQIPNHHQLTYLFMRSFYGDIALNTPTSHQYYYQQSKLYWNKQNSYNQALTALVAYRNNEKTWVLKNILPALLENTISNSKQGMYWKNMFTNNWYQNPIEFQSMMINCFGEINLQEKNPTYTSSISSMRSWLILNKQTNHWKTSIASADACYALLVNGAVGSASLTRNATVEIKLGNQSFNSATEKTTAGSGFFQKIIEGEKVVPEMGNIKIKVSEPNKTTSGNQPSYGAVYWQYIEDLEKITTSAGPLSLTKQLFVERATTNGKTLLLLKDNDEVLLGEKLVVQLSLTTDRDMEYLYVKDLRASAMEPLNVLSGFKWQDRLGYYESTKDVSNNYYISHLPKGTFTLSYEMNATQIGSFSVGIASIQSMYAPEFTSNSGGIKLNIKKID